MAHSRFTVIFLLSCIFLININCDNEFRDNLDEFYRPQIWSLVKYLNSNPKRVYNYNYATLISAQNKDLDNTDLTIDVEVDCRNYRRNKCITSLVECKGTVKYNTETANYEVSSARCNPKIRLNLPEVTRYDDEQTGPPVEEEVAVRTNLQETNAEQLLEPVSEQPFTKQKGPCDGCPIDINPNLESLTPLTDAVLNHIESERNNRHVVLRILRLQSQVVAGIKYTLLLEIAPTDCPKTVAQPELNSCRLLTDNSQICEVEFFQQPWISRSKNIISNNCTSSQEFNTDPTPYPGNDQDNEIDRNFSPGKSLGYPEKVESDDRTNYDSIAEGNTDDMLKITGGIMDSSRMKDLESQIVFAVPRTEEPTVDTSEVEEMTTVAVELESSLTDDQKSAIDDFFGSRKKRGAKNDDSSSSSSSSSEEDNNNNDDHNGDDDDQEKTKRKTKKYRKQDKNDDNNNDDDSSSSSSSSEENNNDDENGKKHKSKKNKRQVQIPDSSSSESSSEEDNELRVKRQAVSSESNESEEKVESSKGKLIKDNKVSSESESSEEHRGGVRRKRDASLDYLIASNSNIDDIDPNEFQVSSESESRESGEKRRKRSLTQTQELVKISSEERNFVENLADFSTTTLDDIDADNHKRVVLQVLGAKKNVAETLYHLTLRVGISKCPEDNEQIIDLQKPKQRDNNCRNKLIENLTKICKVQIRVDSDKTNPKVEKSHCQNIKKDHDDTNVNRTNRSKRGGEKLAGGINSISTNDPKVIEYSKTLLQELDAQDGVANKREYGKILSASRQIVSGTLWRLKLEFIESGSNKICDFEVWDQPWLKEDAKKVTVKCGGQEEKKYRYKRSHNHQEMLGKDDHDVHVGMFKSFMNKHGKKYSNKSEFKRRFRIFRENMKTIKTLNDNEQGTAKYGATFFADLTKEEYKRYLGLNPSLHDPNNIPMPHARIPDVDLPVEFDWRKKNVISEVKNQGQCGSCWAFSVTGNIEGLNAIKTGNLIELSEQELVDCDTLDSGCNGGLPDNAYRAIEQLGGLETETDYPYEAENEKCIFNKTLTKVQISGSVNISSDETDMAKWLIKNGPISIGINANAMQFYMGGVSHPFKFLCSPQNLDHGVLIVGYGVHKYPLFNKVLPYWIVKNSWGPTWGEQGYYRVYRGDGTCGVNQMATSAVL